MAGTKTTKPSRAKKESLKDIDNLWEFLAFLISKPLSLITIGIIALLIIGFMTTRCVYDSSKRSIYMQKKSVDIEKVLNEKITNSR